MTGAQVSRRGVLFTGLASCGAAAVILVSGCGSTSDAQMRMAGGEPGGTYVQFGQLLADAMQQSGALGQLTVLTTDGSVENMALLRAGDAELAIALADSVAEDPAGLVALGRVYQNYLQCVVRVDGPVRGAPDLAGRAVSIGAPGSGTAYTATRVLSALGLMTNPDPVVAKELNLADAVSALGAGEIDALFWSGGIPVPELDRLGDTEVTLIDVSGALSQLAETTGVYQSTAVPAGLYGLGEPMPTIGVSNFLLARPDLSGELASAVVDVLIDRALDLVPEPSAGVQYLTASNLIDTAPVPLHPAALARYRERYG